MGLTRHLFSCFQSMSGRLLYQGILDTKMKDIVSLLSRREFHPLVVLSGIVKHSISIHYQPLCGLSCKGNKIQNRCIVIHRQTSISYLIVYLEKPRLPSCTRRVKSCEIKTQGKGRAVLFHQAAIKILVFFIRTWKRSDSDCECSRDVPKRGSDFSQRATEISARN